MGRLYITVSDGVEQMFRSEVGRRLGFDKGNLSRAVEEALKLWIVASKSGKSFKFVEEGGETK